jgi:GT2 family glycosyltransferase
MTAPSDAITALVVHHRNYPEVLDTVAGVVAAGVPAHRVWVIDTSEDPHLARELEASSHGWHVEAMPNRGYGAAVNHGVLVAGTTPLTLVLTHEVTLGADLVHALADAIAGDPRTAVAGPDILRTRGATWSRGGYLTRLLRLPKHRVAIAATQSGAREVEWLDGAVALYRTDCLRHEPFREDFFLYVEEVELHTRLRKAGWRVVAARGATASQTTQGMPPYWELRNTVLFQAAHGSALSRYVAPVYVLLRTSAVLLVRGRWREISRAWSGLVAGVRRLQQGR